MNDLAILKKTLDKLGFKYEEKPGFEADLIYLSIEADSRSWLGVLFFRPNDELLACDIMSDHLPRELYPDSTRKGFSYEERSKEILKNVESILRGEVFTEKPYILNKNRGYLSLNIDGVPTKISQRKNYFSLTHNQDEVYETVDLEKLKRRIVELLTKFKAQSVISNTKGGDTIYAVITKQAVLTIKIGKKWIGYELKLEKTAPGYPFGTFEDTDMYPLDGYYAKVATDISKDVIACLEGLLRGQVLAGSKDGKSMLAVPLGLKGSYMLCRKGTVLAKKETISRAEVMKIVELKPVA